MYYKQFLFSHLILSLAFIYRVDWWPRYRKCWSTWVVANLSKRRCSRQLSAAMGGYSISSIITVPGKLYKQEDDAVEGLIALFLNISRWRQFLWEYQWLLPLLQLRRFFSCCLWNQRRFSIFVVGCKFYQVSLFLFRAYQLLNLIVWKIVGLHTLRFLTNNFIHSFSSAKVHS